MRSEIREIFACEVCGSSDLFSVLDLKMHPMCDDLVALEENRICNEYPIEILFCKKCKTAHQRFQVEKQTLFPKNYHYRSKQTADVLDGMRDFVTSCKKKLAGLTSKKVVDVGCNDGTLLNFFRQHGALTHGIEPTDAYIEAAANGHKILNAYFTEEVAREFVNSYGCADIITFTNVFAHIENLEQLLRATSILRHSETAIVIENHYLGSILRKKQFDTFYHEHPRTYSYSSFVCIAEQLGMELDLVEFPGRYGGNVRVFLQPSRKSTLSDKKYAELADFEDITFSNSFQNLSKFIETWKDRKKSEIADAVEKNGPLVAKAFPGRAAIPIKMLGLDSDLILGAYEKPDSKKIGYYIPGTRIPIRSDNFILKHYSEGSPIINLAWHIEGEIRQYMGRQGYAGKFINII